MKDIRCKDCEYYRDIFFNSVDGLCYKNYDRTVRRLSHPCEYFKFKEIRRNKNVSSNNN